MIIRNISDPNFTDVVLGVHFTNGISQGHFNSDQLSALKAIGRFEFVVIDDTCQFCDTYKKQIEELREDLKVALKKGKKNADA